MRVRSCRGAARPAGPRAGRSRPADRGMKSAQSTSFVAGLADAGGDQLHRALEELRRAFDAHVIAVVEAAIVGSAGVPHPRADRAAAVGQLDLQVEIAVAVRPQLLLRGQKHLVDRLLMTQLIDKRRGMPRLSKLREIRLRSTRISAYARAAGADDRQIRSRQQRKTPASVCHPGPPGCPGILGTSEMHSPSHRHTSASCTATAKPPILEASPTAHKGRPRSLLAGRSRLAAKCRFALESAARRCGS